MNYLDMTMNRETAQRLLQVGIDALVLGVKNQQEFATWGAIIADAQRVIAETDPKPERGII